MGLNEYMQYATPTLVESIFNATREHTTMKPLCFHCHYPNINKVEEDEKFIYFECGKCKGITKYNKKIKIFEKGEEYIAPKKENENPKPDGQGT